jgi:hypothetical protein
VSFDPTVLIHSSDGFVDATVELGPLLCRASATCEQGPGVPLILRQPARPEGAETLLIELECAGAPGDPPPYLYFEPARVACGPNAEEYLLSSPEADWGSGPIGAHFASFGVATDASALARTSWRIAFALDRAQAAGCTFMLRGTGAAGPLTDGAVPQGAPWPVVDFALTFASSSLPVACGGARLVDGTPTVTTKLVNAPYSFEAEFDGIAIHPAAP